MTGAASNTGTYEGALIPKRYFSELDRRIEQLPKSECLESLSQLEYLRRRVRDRIVEIVEAEEHGKT